MQSLMMPEKGCDLDATNTQAAHASPGVADTLSRYHASVM
ncbi:Uncharacterised protein [Buttiauxella agrestis]|uniref:Uncharacterized protein n=1 Tax=Buttiauxella agrestis TaxID=82977 RepID=A0A381C4C6_9ENTR|nr:Uncharacterised protein [Buttiauxella agrestis]